LSVNENKSEGMAAK